MIKDVYKDAADFSGGEKSKKAAPRKGKYTKNAPVLILDEPTAATRPPLRKKRAVLENTNEE